MKLDICAEIVIHQHVHQHGGVAVHETMLRKMDELFVQLKRGLEMVRQDLKDFSAKFDVATTAIGDRIQRLIDASITLNAEEKAELQRLSDGLDAMAKDPENPVPVIPTA